jgi:hypothetical protein
VPLYHPRHTTPYDFQPFYDVAGASTHVVFIDEPPLRFEDDPFRTRTPPKRCLAFHLLAPNVFRQYPLDFPLIILQDGITRKFRYENTSRIGRLLGFDYRLTLINGFCLRIDQIAYCTMRCNVLESAWADLPSEFEFVTKPGYQTQLFVPGFD